MGLFVKVVAAVVAMVVVLAGLTEVWRRRSLNRRFTEERLPKRNLRTGYRPLRSVGLDDDNAEFQPYPYGESRPGSK